MDKAKKWIIKKEDPKNYATYTFLLIVVGSLVEKVGGILGIYGKILMIVGVYYFFMWIRYKFKK